jgi:SEC-C motif-containing protein
MRSRFTAYVKEQEQYLLATWHPSTQPDGVDMTVSPEWLGLQVISHSLQGNHGIVEFKATYQDGGEIGILHETSRFIKQKNEWFYVDGDLHQPKQGKVGRNDPCPCDSGRKFKKCCR